MNASGLLELYVQKLVSQHQGLLEDILEEEEEGHIPAPDAPGLQEHLATLRNYLKEKGIPEEPDFVFRYALLRPGSFRGITPPYDVLSPQRGGLTKSRLGEVAGGIESFRKFRESVELMGPVDWSDPLAAIRRLTKEDFGGEAADFRSLIEQLPPEEVDELAARAIDLAGGSSEKGRELAEEILRQLANFRPGGLGAMTEVLASKRVFIDHQAFRDGSERTAELLLKALEDPGEENGRYIGLCLAWTRTRTAYEAFRKWLATSAPWPGANARQLGFFMQDAGWTIAKDETRQELISGPCHLLEGLEGDEGSVPVPCREPAGRDCPSCSNELGWLFDLRAVPEALLPWRGEKLPKRVLYCPLCSCYDAVFSTYQEDGSAEWHEANGGGEGSCDPPQPVLRHLSHGEPSLFVVSNPFDQKDAGSIGGAPMWVQDADYPSCPDCDCTMRFLAQFDNGPLGEEGVYYAFYCGNCHVAGVNYQQT